MCGLRQIALFIMLNTLSSENVNIFKSRITKALPMTDLGFYVQV